MCKNLPCRSCQNIITQLATLGKYSHPKHLWHSFKPVNLKIHYQSCICQYILPTCPIEVYVTYSYRYVQISNVQIRHVQIAINSSNNTTYDLAPQRQDDTSFRREGHTWILGRIRHLKISEMCRNFHYCVFKAIVRAQACIQASVLPYCSALF